MKLIIKPLFILCCAAGLASCHNNDTITKADKTEADAIVVDNNKMADPVKTISPEQEFLNYAIPKNTKEIMWIKAGATHGAMKETKDHATMMLKDHNKLAAEIKDYMTQNPSYMMPALDTANEVTILDKKGADFDKAWADKMVSDHEEILSKLNSAKTSVTDANLSKIITNTIPVVESHLSMAKLMQKK